ncbi:MAG: restriction endonuclease subunit S, partial [Candidatus Andersenbacteria bacterium]
GDVLITVKGSGVGKTALCDLDELAISRQLMAVRALAELNRRYLSICIDSAERHFQEQKFGIAIPGIGRDEVLALNILLPSIEEQGRIVNRVDELMRLCDSLNLQLRSAQKVAGRLIAASVSTPGSPHQN